MSIKTISVGNLFVTVSDFARDLLEEGVAVALKRWAPVRAALGETFAQRMEEVASQSKWDRESYGGDHLEELKHAGLHCFAGGLDGAVFANVMYQLGIPSTSSGDLGGRIQARVSALILKLAMQKDADLDLYITSIMKGHLVIKCQDYEDSLLRTAGLKEVRCWGQGDYEARFGEGFEWEVLRTLGYLERSSERLEKVPAP